MLVIEGDDVRQQPFGEKDHRWNAIPPGITDRPLLDRAQQGILLGRVELGKADIVPAPGLNIDRMEPALPCLAQRRQAIIAVPVATVLKELGVDHRRERNRRAWPRLRHDALANCLQNQPLCLREITGVARQGEAFVDDLARLLVP